MMIATWLQAVVLGVVQGLTEFIPVSSSGHLVLVPYLLGWERPGLAFDVALHMGTVGAILVYFRTELIGMARGLVLGDRIPGGLLYRRLALLLVAGSIPVAIVGLTLQDVVADVFENPLAASFLLFGTAAILIGGEKVRDRRVARSAAAAPALAPEDGPVWTGDWVGGRPEAALDAPPASGATVPVGEDPADPSGLSLERIGLREAVLMGVGQTLALFPGISRSGATIMAGVVAGLTREAATRFSFLLALPALAGAGLLQIGDLREPGIYTGTDIALGVVAAFVSGYLAIRFLVALVSRERLTGFARYVVLVGIIGIVGYLMIGPPSSV
jgi:undecaprenyl-diphosphatase